MATSIAPLPLTYRSVVDRLIQALDRNDPEYVHKLRWLLTMLTARLRDVKVYLTDLNDSPGEKQVFSFRTLADALDYVCQALSLESHFNFQGHELGDMPVEIVIPGNELRWSAPGKHGAGLTYSIEPELA